MNTINIIGRLAADPEVRTTSQGARITSFTVACDKRRNDKSGSDTDFFKCYAWGNTGDNIDKFFHKGTPIFLTGYIQSRKWKDQQGTERMLWEVNVTSWCIVPRPNEKDGAAQDSERRQEKERAEERSRRYAPEPAPRQDSFYEDELPF